MRMVTPSTFARIWERVESDGGFWEDMAASPSCGSLGADEGEKVVDAVGKGLEDTGHCCEEQGGDVVMEFLRQDME